MTGLCHVFTRLYVARLVIPEQEKVMKPKEIRPKSSIETGEEERAGETDTSIQDEHTLDHLLKQKPGSRLVFHRSEDNYTRDHLQFTIDVVSLWNVPNRDKAYIIFGVIPEQRPPHTVIGLPCSQTETFCEDLFQWQLFVPQFVPRFFYREVMYYNKRIGIIELKPNCGVGFPCIVTSNDMAPRMKRNQLWVRRVSKNTVVENSDLFVGDIHAWFRKSPKDIQLIADAKDSTATPEVDRAKRIQSPTTLSVPSAESENASAQAQQGRSGVTKAHGIMKALNYFKEGHFVLVCGSLKAKCGSIEALARVPWIAVYDFDISGRKSGLLATLEDSIKSKRSLKVSTWCDPYAGLTDLGTQWWSLRGRREIPQSKTSDASHQKWFSLVRDKVDKLCIELARYSEDYTVLTFLVLWPQAASELEARCMHKFLTKVREYVRPRLILCSTDPEIDFCQSRVAQMIQYEYEGEAQMFHTPLEDLCSEVRSHTQDTGTPDGFQYQLPADSKTPATITREDAAWLAEDLDVLYLKSPYANLTANDLKAEADNFFRGGTIGWRTWYTTGPGYLDVERSISNEMTTHIQEQFIAKGRNGMVSLFHAPGSGGSTMTQRVLWDLHEAVPCAKVKLRSGSSLESVADKLIFLQQQSSLPVVALLDGEDEPRLKQILFSLHRSPVVLLHVKRYPYRLDESRSRITSEESSFYLSGFVTKEEAATLVLRFRERCGAEESKLEKLEKLDKDIQKGRQKHQMFEFGMAVYAHDFQGIRAYVRGYLGLNPNPSKKLEPWQRCLGYMSLMYYYGQMSCPCQLLVTIMERPEEHIMNLDDFPDQFQILVVEDSNEGRDRCLRIAHYIIAREILEQILNRRSGERRPVEEGKKDSSRVNHASCRTLSEETKHHLKNFCIEYIHRLAGQKSTSTLTSNRTIFILTKTFIFRDTEEVGDVVTVGTHARRKPQFSQLMIDLDSDAPFHSRLEVLETLCQAFPEDPNFQAHMGRFFSICRPNEWEETESHFMKAIELCKSQSRGKNGDELDERSNQSLIHIYHMFGNAFQRRIVKYTGWNAGDVPKVRVRPSEKDEILEEVIRNARTACHYFLQARLHTPHGQEDGYTYMNDIHMRLQASGFVNNVYSGGVRAFLSSKDTDEKVKFIRNSVTVIEELIVECHSIIQLDMHGKGIFLKQNVRWFYDLFQPCTKVLEPLLEGEDLTSLRLDLSRKKLEFGGSEFFAAVANPEGPADVIESIVNILERIFLYYSKDLTDREFDLLYQDWILAIRNPQFAKVRYSFIVTVNTLAYRAYRCFQALDR